MMRLRGVGQSPRQVMAWLERVRRGSEPAPSPAEDLNQWLGLLVELRDETDRRHDLAWARVTLAVYRHLASELSGWEGSLGERSRDEMAYRVYLIARHGAVPGDATLDPAAVVEWARAALRDLPLPAARALAESCRSRMRADTDDGLGSERRAALVADLRRLRWIKHRLKVARDLTATCGVPLDEELRQWLVIFDQLP